MVLYLLVALVFASNSIAGTVYPLKKSANGRYLVDQSDRPYLITGDSPQALMVKVSESDAETFVADRSVRGFNTLWVNLLCTTYTGGNPDGSTIDGTLPFTNMLPGTVLHDLASPNEVYFAHIDRILNLASQYGVQILLNPIETAGWLDTILTNGTSKCRNYGRYLGNRYKSFDNIIWMSGNDYWQWVDADTDAMVREVALGIKDTDARHLHTVELNVFVSGSLDAHAWAPIIDLNASYTYYPTYAQLLKDYNRTNFLPNFMVEANYELEYWWTGNNTLRRQEYWAMLSGATGQLYGHKYTWQFISGWQAQLGSLGSVQMGYVKSLFESRAWHNLIPDQDHSVVTAGYGTSADMGSVNDSDYATAARTSDGTLVMAYMPTRRTLTVDMSRLSGSAVARWYDPSRGLYFTIEGSPFSNVGAHDFLPPETNWDGDGDWVLVLETQTPEAQSPTVTLTAPPAGATVSNSIAIVATASDNLAVVGVQFQVNGADLGPEVLAPPYATVWNTLSAVNGSHFVQGVARDLAGNRTTNQVSVNVLNGTSPRLSPVAAYAFNENAGTTAADGSGNGNTATISGAAWTNSAKYGSGLSFFGSDWITAQASDSLDITNSITIEAWVYPTELPINWGTIALKETTVDLAYALLLYTESGRLRPELYIRAPGGLLSLQGPHGLSLNTWSHIAGTYDGTRLQLYVNGRQVANLPGSGSIISSGNPLRVGGNSIWGEYFIGGIDEVRIYNRALGQNEIQHDMNTPIGLNSPPSAAADHLRRYLPNGVKVRIATLLRNDSDPEGDPLNVVAVDSVSVNGGNIRQEEGWIYYTALGGFTNNDSFNYSINDGHNQPVSGTVFLEVSLDPIPSPNLTIFRLTPNSYRIRFDGIPDVTYRIEYAEGLNPASWQNLGNQTATDVGLIEIVDVLPFGSLQRFYRSVYP